MKTRFRSRRSLLSYAVESNCEDSVTQLFKSGVRLEDSSFCLNLAIKKGNFEIVKLLIQNGADIHTKNMKVGNFPVAMAYALENYSTAIKLFKLGLGDHFRFFI